MSMEEHASDSPLVIRENITATADIPPQLPSQSPTADVVIDSPSMRCTEHLEQRPLEPSRSPHDIV